jgi:hypothetical protein
MIQATELNSCIEVDILKLKESDYFSIAKCIDNEYIGREKYFRFEIKGGVITLSTSSCDMASFIKVYHNNYACIYNISIMGHHTDGWEEITNETFKKVKKIFNP